MLRMHHQVCAPVHVGRATKARHCRAAAAGRRALAATAGQRVDDPSCLSHHLNIRSLCLNTCLPSAPTYSPTHPGSLPWLPFVMDFVMMTVSAQGRERSMR
jgi:hypothetical protein